MPLGSQSQKQREDLPVLWPDFHDLITLLGCNAGQEWIYGRLLVVILAVVRLAGVRQFPNRPSVMAVRYWSMIWSAAPGISSHNCATLERENSTSRFQPSTIFMM